MAKAIHLLLSRKSFEELEQMKAKLCAELPDFLKEKVITYEEYLVKEKLKPTIVLLG